jgi:hypothetical protein
VRGAVLAVLVFACASALAAAPAAEPEEAKLELVGLRSIAGWLKAQGADGYVGADVARALGIANPDGGSLDARQRGFRNAAVLRIAQLLPDESVLFMVQDGAGEVYFYHSTLRRGLRRALVSLPGRKLVLPLESAEAESKFRAEVLYWEDKAATTVDER